MKKFIVFIITAIIMAVSFTSCGGKVEKDIKAIVGNDVKVCAVKSIDIKENFYQYTEEFTTNHEQYENCRELTATAREYMADAKNDMDFYKRLGYNDSYKISKESYEYFKKEWEDCSSRLDEYAKKDKDIRSNGKQVGKIYVAKFLGRNEYTHKPNEYNSYSIFSYNNDGTLHPIETDEDMRIIFSVYPKAKEDLKKVMGDAMGALVDAFKDIDI